MAKKFLSILLVLVLVLGLLPAAGAAALSTSPTFSDMPDNWATEALESAVANGLLIGDDGKIMPDSPLTRAQMATVVARAFGAIEEGDISEYTDVKSTDWFAGSIAKAYKMGIMHGYAGKMDPDDNITREQAFAVLARALKLEPASGINKTFEDVDEISDWAKGEVYALVNAGYIQGSNGKLNPQANISRAEFAQMMHNLIKQYIKAEGEYTEAADGNIMVNVPGVTLKNVTINGDLIIGDGVGDGDLILDNVTVKGRLVARGGGVNSIIIIGGSVEGKVIVAKVDGDIRVSVEGGADVEVIVIDDGKDDVIIEGTVGTVEIAASEVPVVVQNATVGTIEVMASGAANITVANGAAVTDVVVNSSAAGTALNIEGKVNTVETSAANTAVSGTGTVSTVTAKEGADHTAVTTPNTKVNNEGASGVTAGGGKEVPENGSVNNNNQGTDITTPPSGGGPSYVAISAISVTPKELTLTVGETGQITATVTPSNATNKKVNWTSSDENIATVDENGKVTAVDYGIATITATSAADNTKTVTCKVIVANDWSNLADTSWYDDSQTSFTISTAAELAGLAELVNSGTNFSGKTINLGADIDLLNLEWIPIGTKENTFRGKFDGADMEISNLKIDTPEATNVGLFGYVTGGSLSNLKLKDVEINAKEAVGALVGNVRGLSEPISNIEGRFIDIQSTHWAGGLIGYSYASVKDCSVDEANVTLTYDTSINDNGDKAGGITGYQSEGNFYYENCRTSNVEIVGVRDVGGLVGASQYNVYYINCHVEFSVIKAEVNDPSFEHAQPYAGGLIGRAAGSITLFDCSATPGGIIDDVFVPGVIVSSYKDGFAGELVGGPVSNVTIAKVLNSTQKKAYETIQVAIDAAQGGDTILVAEGTYVENLIIPSGKEGLVLKSVSGADATVIDGNIALGADNITIEGFTIGNSGARNGYVGLEGTDGSKITNNIINGSKATVSIGNTTGNTVDSVTIEGNTINGGTIGLYPTSGSTITISNNTINSGNGEIIWIHGAGQNSTSLILDIQGNIAIQEEDVITIHFKPVSINGVVDELDMISTIRNDNEPVKVVLGWVKTVGAIGADFTTIQGAVDGVNEGDTILVKVGTYTADNTNPIIINKKVTLIGDNATIEVSNGNQPIKVNADGTVIQGFTITKTDKAHQDIIYINANDVTIMNNVISGQYEIGDAQVDRAILGVSGKTGIQIVGNTISNLRQPAYFNGGNTGEVEDNYVTNTRGWVVGGDSNMTFTGNSFGTNAVDIAIIPNDNVINNYGTTPQEIIAISNSNNEAYVENQLSNISAKNGQLYNTVYIIAGETTKYFSNIQDAITTAVKDDTVVLGSDIEVTGQLWIRKDITIDGNGKTITSTASEASKHSAIKIDSLGSGTTLKNLTVIATGYTGNVLYISTATDVEITGNTFESIDNKAMGVYFDRSSSGKLTDNDIVGRKGVGADTVGEVTIIGNEITFIDIGIELHDGTPERNTQEINDSSTEVNVHNQYTVSGNTFNK